jgi:hypothetical protein
MFDWATTGREAIQGKLPDVGDSVPVPDWMTTGREKLQTGIGGVGGAAAAAKDWVPNAAAWAVLPVPRAAYAAYQHLNPGMPGGGGGGGDQQQQQGAAGAVNPSDLGPPSDYPTYTPFINPLAMNAFFSKNIAPMMAQIGQQFGQQSNAAMGKAEANLGRFQMPAQFKAYFGQALPQMANDQAMVQASLMQAAAAQPQYETMMKGIGNLQNQAQQVYSLQAARKALQDAGTQAGVNRIFAGQQ